MGEAGRLIVWCAGGTLRRKPCLPCICSGWWGRQGQPSSSPWGPAGRWSYSWRPGSPQTWARTTESSFNFFSSWICFKNNVKESQTNKAKTDWELLNNSEKFWNNSLNLFKISQSVFPLFSWLQFCKMATKWIQWFKFSLPLLKIVFIQKLSFLSLGKSSLRLLGLESLQDVRQNAGQELLANWPSNLYRPDRARAVEAGHHAQDGVGGSRGRFSIRRAATVLRVGECSPVSLWSSCRKQKSEREKWDSVEESQPVNSYWHIQERQQF